MMMATQFTLVGQYGKQNPLFMYQGTGGFCFDIPLNLKAAVNANNAESRLCGTLPNISTVGYAAEKEINAALSASAYAVSPAESGVPSSGVLPDTSTVGYAAGSAMSATYSAKVYSASPAQSGVPYSGTMPE